MKSFLIGHSEMSCDKRLYCSLKAIILQNLSFLTDCSPPKKQLNCLSGGLGGASSQSLGKYVCIV